eukprot:m.172163 g.172163  ORF g.172163 m.172163 type:complete len:64 (+) comp39081_c1_seq2:111-302(+)
MKSALVYQGKPISLTVNGRVNANGRLQRLKLYFFTGTYSTVILITVNKTSTYKHRGSVFFFTE